ncbi:MAG: hypothetical protein GX452_07315 [Ignavibacteriales bacterium]|nr:hypothetical protein [Ignavibacteriaceae bacterium]NLH61196.1 hypothetical protein [Ignavibacteriales bacterium]HPO55920.1 hypothetical protein [Ignavibacteriaceae bacterium]
MQNIIIIPNLILFEFFYQRFIQIDKFVFQRVVIFIIFIKPFSRNITATVKCKYLRIILA